MIATILPSSPTFHAVAYNERKLAEGKACLLEIKNFGAIDNMGYTKPDELRDYLIEYSSRNSRIKQPQFHLAISCKGHEYTHEQLVQFAHQYLKEMGYGDPEQPVLIYAHHDTDNTHIHIVTSRVNPEGKKINDSNERRKSQKVIDKILNTDLKKQAEKDIQSALFFDFRNMNQFKAIMEAMNYECYEKNGELCVKKGGMIQSKVKIDQIAAIAESNKNKYKPDVARYAQLRVIFKKYRDMNTSRTGLEKDLKRIFGISLVCFGKKDSPYGYFAVDFRNKKIIEGAKILGIKDLFSFRTKEELNKEIEDLIGRTFEANPYISTKKLNSILNKLGAYVKKNYVVSAIEKLPLAEKYQALLQRNNRIEFINSFRPQSQEERDFLCRMFKFNYPNMIDVRLDPRGRYYCNDTELTSILSMQDNKERLKTFGNSGYRIIKTDNGSVMAFHPERKTLVDMQRAGFPEESYYNLVRYFYPERTKNQSASAPRSNKASGGKKTLGNNEHIGMSSNREWEVGKKGYDQDDMDRKNGMSH